MSAIGRGPSTKPNGQTKKLVIKPLKRKDSDLNSAWYGRVSLDQVLSVEGMPHS
jgi:hypothetical protein